MCKYCNNSIGDKAKILYNTFCSIQCLRKYTKEESLGGSPPNINKSDKGILGEHAVIADLIRKGFNVFKAVNRHSPFDLLIEKDDIIMKVEVKTGGRNDKTGTLYFGSTVNNDFHILAVYDLVTTNVYYIHPF